MIRLISIRKLVEELRNGITTEKEKVTYFALSIGCLGILNTVSSLSPSLKTEIGGSKEHILVFFALRFFVFFTTLRACYLKNISFDNKDFTSRWICISVPSFVWATIATQPWLLTTLLLIERERLTGEFAVIITYCLDLGGFLVYLFLVNWGFKRLTEIRTHD